MMPTVAGDTLRGKVNYTDSTVSLRNVIICIIKGVIIYSLYDIN